MTLNLNKNKFYILSVSFLRWVTTLKPVKENTSNLGVSNPFGVMRHACLNSHWPGTSFSPRYGEAIFTKTTLPRYGQEVPPYYKLSFYVNCFKIDTHTYRQTHTDTPRKHYLYRIRGR